MTKSNFSGSYSNSTVALVSSEHYTTRLNRYIRPKLSGKLWKIPWKKFLHNPGIRLSFLLEISTCFQIKWSHHWVWWSNSTSLHTKVTASTKYMHPNMYILYAELSTPQWKPSTKLSSLGQMVSRSIWERTRLRTISGLAPLIFMPTLRTIFEIMSIGMKCWNAMIHK